MSRLVVISNRVAMTEEKDQATALVGGLAVAMETALKDSGGLWFGWSGKLAPKRPRAPSVVKSENVTLATLDLTKEDFEEYYNGFSNRTLWPLFHYRTDLTTYDRDNYEGYLRVNQLFARHLSRLLTPDDIIWAHDYHLIPIGEELRRLGHNQPMGFFLHIPFPAAQILLTLPRHKSLVRALFAYDLVGFQTKSDLHALHDYVREEAHGDVRGSGSVNAYGKVLRAGVFPIGIDAEEFAAMAQSTAAQRYQERTRQSLSGRKLIIGVDRLDYSKGLQERLQAFERFLEVYPKNRGRVTLMQVSPLTRTNVPEYRVIRRELERLTGHVNGRFAEFDWVPVRYLNKSFARSSLAGLYRAADVALVTPLRDGMNLVAMEYVAAQAEEDPGVLILSRFAGAVHQLPGAVVVNPYDPQGVADALARSLVMPAEERRERWARMMANLKRHDLTKWRLNFVRELKRLVVPA